MTWDLDIALYLPGLPADPTIYARQSLGGSETAGICMARELGKLGHHVTVFSNGEPGEYEGVTYRALSEWGAWAMSVPQDVAIVQRQPEVFGATLPTRLNVLWCHDLAVGRRAAAMRAVQWNVDRVLTVSDYMKGQYQEVYSLPPDRVVATRNGLDLELFQGLGTVERRRKTLIYAARPERGLDVLLDWIFPALLERDPDLRLFVCGYDNPVEHLRELYAHCHQRMRELGDRAVWLGHLSKRDLYRHYCSAGVYVYPTPSPLSPMFAEVSCISLMECQSAGVPVVSSRRGALAETLDPDAGVLLDGDPWTDEYRAAMVEAVLWLTSDADAWQRASKAGRRRAQGLSWAGVAEQWSAWFSEWIAAENRSPARLAHHFLRRSDVIAAAEVCDRHPGEPGLVSVTARLEREWGFRTSPDGIREQYEKIGQTHTDVYESAQREPRYAYLRAWLRDHPEAAAILDFGCAHGSYAVGLSNDVPGRRWVGVDVDQHSIDWAERNRRERAQDPTALTFLVGNERVDLSAHAPFDALILFETLEHVVEPWDCVDGLERWVRPGGRVLITVPYGPWEHESYETYPYRCHLWEFDLHDLRDVFGKKKALTITTMSARASDRTREPLGWHIVEYVVNGTPCRPVDLDRKLALQRPRQSLSGLVIAGPGAEGTLHWCLESLRAVTDEIVLADCGMSEEARRIADGYGVQRFPASNPRQAGFETPRNEALECCRMDWVLWIDTDEKLIGAPFLPKYLRGNAFSGYSIRQHHFACDSSFKPDLPVRCFRRGPGADGKALRWIGMIHEHPEYGVNEGPGPTIVLSDVHIAHVGYLAEKGRREKFGRNWPLLMEDVKKYPDRLLQKHFLCRDNALLAQWEIQRLGGRISPETRGRLEEVVRLYREHFMGKGSYIGTDTLQYYSQALALLGRGVDVKMRLEVSRDGERAEAPALEARFETLEEAEREIAVRLRETGGAMVTPWW